MKIVVTANRIKCDKNIIECFKWTPQTRYAIDTKRKLFHKIRDAINLMAIHKYGFKLININYFCNEIIYYYNLNKNIPPKISEQKIINYFPVLGKKTCIKCINFKKYNGNGYCVLKGKKIKKKSWYRCLYWQESGLIGGKQNRILYKQTRSKRYDKTNRRIS